MAEKKQNVCLDVWKGFACFGVAFFHIGVPNPEVDGVIQAIFRFAMPLFFMISGYFSYDDQNQILLSRLPSKMKHIWKVSWIGCAYYACFHLAIGLFGDSHGGWLAAWQRLTSLFTPKSMTDWLLFNEDPFINLMWFTFALLYCYLILYWIAKHQAYQIAYRLIPVFLLIHLTMGNFMDLFGIQIERVYYRNFLLYGFPFFFLGNWLRKNNQSVCRSISLSQCVLMIGGGGLLSGTEWLIYGRQELYVGSLLMVIGIFVMSMKNPEQNFCPPIGKIGKDYSLFIYIVHYSLISVFDRVAYSILGEHNSLIMLYRSLKVFLIFGTCISMAACFYYILRAIRKRGSVL